MRVYTGNQELDEILKEKGNFILVYGEPGSGKTNLIIKIVRESVSRGVTSLYISTEGSLNIERLLEVAQGFEDRIFISTPGNLSELLLSVLRSLSLGVGLVAIDSINYFYRIESGSSYRSNEMFLSLLGLIKYISETRDTYFIASAQVREINRFIEPSGIDVISFFKPYMLQCRKISTNLFEVFLSDLNKRFRYSIDRRDLVWTSSEK
ncbi:MAG: hypothetical protein ABWJ42_01270 [Sulfolobales archaeon]